MNPLIWLTAVAQVAVPLVLIAWFARRSPRGRTAWLLEATIVAAYLVAIALAGVWLLLPWHTSRVYAVLFALAALRSRAAIASPPPAAAAPAPAPDRRATLGLLARAAAAVVTLAVAAAALAGHRRPAGAVEVDFPLRSGTYIVANGGANDLVNLHLGTLDLERARPFRGQSYAVDIVAIDRWGLRAAGFMPTDPAAYRIFGHAIHAPCAGRVVMAVDGLADLPPPQADREHLAGNHVLLACGGAWILLGHMRQGTVAVQTGDDVEAGQVVGQVGNSGNTSEPHLHIHAQTPGTDAAPLGGEPLPIVLGGRYLARGMRVTMGD